MEEGCSINDMSLAAWLVAIHDFELVKAQRLGRSFLFTLKIPEGKDPEKLKLAFLSSESCKFDSKIRDFKKIIFSEKS